MSTPMDNFLEHFYIDVNAEGEGPVDRDGPEYDMTICWCKDGKDCQVFLPRKMR